MTDNRPPQRAEQRLPQRRRVKVDASNRFDIYPEEVPEGAVVEWKRETVFGREDTEHMINLEQNGWTPVKAKQIPRLAGSRLKDDEPIRRGGLMAMQLPKEWAVESKGEALTAAERVVRDQKQRLGMQNVGGKGVKQSFEAVPED